MHKISLLEKNKKVFLDSSYKSKYTAKDFYGFIEGIKISERILEKELKKAKKLFIF